MGTKPRKPEEIVAMLRQADVLAAEPLDDVVPDERPTPFGATEHRFPSWGP